MSHSTHVGFSGPPACVARPSPAFGLDPARLWLPFTVGVAHFTAVDRSGDFLFPPAAFQSRAFGVGQAFFAAIPRNDSFPASLKVEPSALWPLLLLP